MTAPAPLAPCPSCGAFLHGFGSRCWECGWVRPADAPAKAAAIPDTRSEEEIRVAIKQALRKLGFDIWDNEQQRADPRVDAGLSDLIVIGFGVLAFAEIKSAKGVQNDAQKEFERVVRSNGGRYCVWRNTEDALNFAAGVMGRTQSGESA